MPTHITPHAFIYIIDDNYIRYVKSDVRPALSFQFLDFESGVEDSFNPSFPESLPAGRPAPFLTFQGNKLRTIRFTALFIDEETSGEAFRFSRILQSLKLPWRRENTDEPYLLEMFPPPLIRLTVLSAGISVEGYLSQCEVQYMAPLTQPSGVDDPKSQQPAFLDFPSFPESSRETRLPFYTSDQFIPGQINCACEITVSDDKNTRLAHNFLFYTP